MTAKASVDGSDCTRCVVVERRTPRKNSDLAIPVVVIEVKEVHVNLRGEYNQVQGHWCLDADHVRGELRFQAAGCNRLLAKSTRSEVAWLKSRINRLIPTTLGHPTNSTDSCPPGTCLGQTPYDTALRNVQ